ncbi:MAG: hypothetical protein NTV48_00960 [Candidatus Vogelbacteria bacterium]|nr:hypothetical protein [Candidatus Vogelbacteria bacterium]
MDEELKQLLKENIELAKKNQEIMAKIARIQQLTIVWGVIKWTIIIGTTVGAFYLLKPMLESLMGTYTSLLGGNTGSGSIADLKSLLGQ